MASNLVAGYSTSCGCQAAEGRARWNRSRIGVSTAPPKPEYDRAYHARNREKVLARLKARYQAMSETDRAKEKERQAKWRAEHPELHRLSSLKARVRYKFGIEREEYERKLAAQGNKCGICRAELSDSPQAGRERKALDHDHETGKIREFLCNGCNLGISAFRESPEALMNAIEYLKRHKS